MHTEPPAAGRRFTNGRAIRTVAVCTIALSPFLVVPVVPAYPSWAAPNGPLSVAGLAAISAIVALATALFVHLTGLPSLAHAGLWGVGAYSSAIAMRELDVGFWTSLVFAAVASAIVGLPIALVSLRTSGMGFLIVTLAFSEFIVLTLGSWEGATNGLRGLSAPTEAGSLGMIDLDDPLGRYYVFVTFAVVTLVVCGLIRRSRFGARLSAIRDNEDLARSVGLDVLWHRVLLFEISAVLVGLAGPLLLLHQRTITPDLFGVFSFLDVYLMIVLGGAATLIGPFLGAWIVRFLPEWLGSTLGDPNTQRLVYGLLLVGFILFARDGLVGLADRGFQRLVRRSTAPVARSVAHEVVRPSPPTVPTPPDAGGAAVGGLPVLGVRDLVKRFGGAVAVQGLNLDVRAGEVLGLIGPNGSGKTTTLNCITAFVARSSGSVLCDGEPIAARRFDAVARIGVVRTFQQPELFASMTARQSCSLVMSADRALGRRTRVNEQLNRSGADLLERCGLREVADAPCGDLSYGQTRLLGVALALARRPFALLLDEPAAGLNDVDTRLLQGVVLDARRRGVAVVIVEHDMAFLLPIADRLIVLDHGVEIAEGVPSIVCRDPQVVAAYLGDRFAMRQSSTEAVVR